LTKFYPCFAVTEQLVLQTRAVF